MSRSEPKELQRTSETPARQDEEQAIMLETDLPQGMSQERLSIYTNSNYTLPCSGGCDPTKMLRSVSRGDRSTGRGRLHSVQTGDGKRRHERRSIVDQNPLRAGGRGGDIGRGRGEVDGS